MTVDRPMSRAEAIAFNRGVVAVCSIARASATLLRAKITEKPTRYAFAVEALDGIVEAGSALIVALPANGAERK